MESSKLRKAQEALDMPEKFESRHGNIIDLIEKSQKHTLNIIAPIFETNLRVEKFLNEMTNSIILFSSRFNDLLDFHANVQSKVAKQINELTKNMSNVFNHQKLILSDLNSIFLAVSLRSSEIEAAQRNALGIVLPLLNQQARFLDNFQKALNNSGISERFEMFQNTFVGNLAHSFRDAIESSENEKEAMRKVEALVEEKLIESSSSSFTTQNTIAMILTLLGIIATCYFNLHNLSIAEKSSETQQLRYKQLLEAIEKIVKNTNPQNSEIEVYYVIEREFDVRTKPDFKSVKFSRFYRNTKVKLIVEKHKWIYVEWTDYLDAVPRYGWVNKKYLKKLN